MAEALSTLKALDAPAEAPAAATSSERLGAAGPVLALMWIAFAALLIAVSVQDYLYVPFFDVHDWIGQVFVLERTHDWLAYLWTPHTAERIPWARVTEWLDIDVARGRAPSFLIASSAAWLCGCVPLAVVLARWPGARTARIFVVLLAALLLTQVALAEDFAFPVFSVYPMVAGPALGAAVMLQCSAATGLRSWPFWTAVALAAAACGGNAAGMAIWPALVVTAGLQRRGREQFFALVICAAIVIVAVQSGLGAPSESLGRNEASVGAHLLKMTVYFLHFVGLPWTQQTHSGLAAVIGIATLALALIAASRAVRWTADDGLAQRRGVALGLILFGLATAAMATIGRVDELPTAIVPTRYTPFATLLQLGILLGLAEEVGRWRARFPIAIAAPLALGILVSDLHDTRSLHRTSHRIQAASLAFDRDGDATHDRILIHPRPAFAADIRRQLAARGLPH